MQHYVAAAGKTSRILEQDQRSWFLVYNKSYFVLEKNPLKIGYFRKTADILPGLSSGLKTQWIKLVFLILVPNLWWLLKWRETPHDAHVVYKWIKSFLLLLWSTYNCVSSRWVGTYFSTLPTSLREKLLKYLLNLNHWRRQEQSE